MDLWKAFDCIPHDLIIGKRHAYGFSLKRVTFIYTYLKRRKQKVKVNNVLSDFLTLRSEAPQESILNPILFNIFLKDLLSTLKLSDLFTFADDNTISATADNIDHLMLTLKHGSELAVKWFMENLKTWIGTSSQMVYGKSNDCKYIYMNYARKPPCN